MSFLDTPRFPDCISFGASGGPGYRTDIVSTDSGWEQRNAPWASARATFDVAHAARKFSDYKLLLNHFRAVNGRLHGFRYKDWADFSAASGEGAIVTLTGGAKQLAKKYTAGALTEYRPISKPVSGTVTITGGGTLDYTTGIITGGSPTAWVGDFDVPCRYDTDLMHAEIINRNLTDGLIMGWSSIMLIEIRVG
jgi:uncharacterized protein (TIGR02217 family)